MIVSWGFNPGQARVKNSLFQNGQVTNASTFPAVIAPQARTDDLGMSRSQVLTAEVGGREYIGGRHAERLALAQRQQAEGRLDPASPMYQALIQMSAQLLGLQPDTQAVVATALPASWMSPENVGLMKDHVRSGLKNRVFLAGLYVQSEPGAVIYHELLTPTGDLHTDRRHLATGLIAVGDLGGSTINRALVESLEALPGQSVSKYLGSRWLIDKIAESRSVQAPDAERMIREELTSPGTDPAIGNELSQYREAVIAEFQSAWAGLSPTAYLFAGGTSHWFVVERNGQQVNLLEQAFGPKARVLPDAQQVIAVGLARYAAMKVARQAQNGSQAWSGAA